MNITKLEIAAYCLGKRMQGYQLLRNPKNSPYTTVKFIKSSTAINPKTLDVTTSYKRVTKNFSSFNETKLTEYLDVDRYLIYNRDIREVDIAKDVNYLAYDGKYEMDAVKFSEKSNVDFAKLRTRDLSYLKKPLTKQLVSIPNMSRGVFGLMFKKDIEIEQPTADVILAAYKKNMNRASVSECKKGFLSTLLRNLKQS